MQHNRFHKNSDQDEDQLATPEEGLVTPEELAVYLRLSYSKIQRLTASGCIKAISVGGQPRYVLSEVRAAFRGKDDATK